MKRAADELHERERVAEIEGERSPKAVRASLILAVDRHQERITRLEERLERCTELLRKIHTKLEGGTP